MAKKLTPVKAIRAKCLDCCCYQQTEVRLCVSKECPLWPYRMGHRPKNEEVTAEDTETEKTADSEGFSEQEEISEGEEV